MQNLTMSAPIKALLASTVLLMATSGAIAQTTTAPVTNPSTVGVTPQDASEAMRKAVPRTDTATVVRTDDSAPDRARNAVDAARPNNAATPGAILRRDNTAANRSAVRKTTRNTARRARADRN